MAAGPDDIRGLNPIHIDELDALTEPRVFPIPGFDGFASRHNHPSQAEELFDPLASLNMKYSLGEITAYCGNLHGGRPLSLWRSL